MVALGFALIWGGYALGLWGWCLVRDYDVTFGQLVSPTHPYGSGQNEPWPPATMPPTQLWPGAQAASTSPPPAASPGGQPDKQGNCPPGQLNIGGKCMDTLT